MRPTVFSTSATITLRTAGHKRMTHLKHFHALIEKVRLAFKPGTNVDMLVHQIFDTMLAFATRVLNGEMENSEATTEWTFEQIYSFVVPNVRAEVLEEEDKKEAI